MFGGRWKRVGGGFGLCCVGQPCAGVMPWTLYAPLGDLPPDAPFMYSVLAVDSSHTSSGESVRRCRCFRCEVCHLPCHICPETQRAVFGCKSSHHTKNQVRQFRQEGAITSNSTLLPVSPPPDVPYTSCSPCHLLPLLPHISPAHIASKYVPFSQLFIPPSASHPRLLMKQVH